MGNLLSVVWNNVQLTHQSIAARQDEAGGFLRKWWTLCRGIRGTRTTFDDLPDEVILEIFSHFTLPELISNVKHVCVRWRYLSRSSMLWRDRGVKIPANIPEDLAILMLQDMQQLQILKVDYDAGLPVINAVFNNCASLTTLDIGDCHKIRDSHLIEKMVQKCPNIMNLTISHKVLGNDHNAQTLSRLNRLRKLVVTVECNNKKRVHLVPIAQGCPALECFELFSTANVHRQDLLYFLTRKSASLTAVQLPWSTYTRNGRTCVVPLLQVCTSLHSLKLNDCSVISSDEARDTFTLMGSMSTLEYLGIHFLEGCPYGAADLAFESGGLSRLQVLNLSCSDVGDTAVVAACRHCLDLRELVLLACFELTDNALVELYRLKNLEKLVLSDCCSLRGEAVKYVAQVATLRQLYLERLNLRDIEPGISKVLDLISLETVSFNGSGFVSIFPFNRLPQRLVNLRVLNLNECRVDEMVVKWLQEAMPTLKVKYKFRDSDAAVDLGETFSEDSNTDDSDAESYDLE